MAERTPDQYVTRKREQWILKAILPATFVFALGIGTDGVVDHFATKANAQAISDNKGAIDTERIRTEARYNKLDEKLNTVDKVTVRIETNTEHLAKQLEAIAKTLGEIKRNGNR